MWCCSHGAALQGDDEEQTLNSIVEKERQQQQRAEAGDLIDAADPRLARLQQAQGSGDGRGRQREVIEAVVEEDESEDEDEEVTHRRGGGRVRFARQPSSRRQVCPLHPLHPLRPLTDTPQHNDAPAAAQGKRARHLRPSALSLPFCWRSSGCAEGGEQRRGGR